MKEHLAAHLVTAAGTAIMTLGGVVAIVPMLAASSARARPAMYTLGVEHAPTRTLCPIQVKSHAFCWPWWRVL